MNKVIYDNNCDLCCFIKNSLEKLDFFNMFVWIKSDNCNKDQLNQWNINKTLLSSTIILINSKNIQFTEFAACRYIISRNLVLFPISIFLYVPFISNHFGNNLYKYISRKRHCIRINL